MARALAVNGPKGLGLKLPPQKIAKGIFFWGKLMKGGSIHSLQGLRPCFSHAEALRSIHQALRIGLIEKPTTKPTETIDMRRTPMHAPTPEETARAAKLFEAWRPWLECEAQSAAIKEARGFTAKTLGEMMAEPDPPGFVRRRVEIAYRRGYFHGFGEALDNLLQAGAKHSAAWTRVARFCDGPLHRWRYACNPKMSQLPPSFDPRETDNEAAA